MSFLTKEQILGIKDLPCKEVTVEDWNGTVRVQRMDGVRRDEFETYAINRREIAKSEGKKRDLRGLKAKVVQLSVVNEDGSLVFSEEDIEALLAKSGSALDVIFQVASELSALGEKEIGDAEKN